ncbi:hypothetical protein [Catenuloplanes indicus]|uniref:Uncharacterized protein n=1 Tax=Catenuloplanes indicus TaxID=137267 RepID=A0AAE3W827_9ACTN|nr:hypothetical protein [Catenuloplanes indicus]MDQ0371573.1 hypothetical protein [Catenuloplanes indicus]
MTGSYTPQTCVIASCGSDLHVTWTLGMPLYRMDVEQLAGPPTPDGAYTSDWKVECEAGHVVLVPSQDSPSDPDGTADYDSDECYRTFRRSDLERLAALIPASGCPNCPPGYDCETGRYATEPATSEENAR